MEVMSDILRSIRVMGSVYFCSQVESPWTKTFSGLEDASFHMIRRGACWASVDGRIKAGCRRSDLRRAWHRSCADQRVVARRDE